MQTRRETLIAYLLSSVEAEDWHAVRDAAVDIEVLDAREGRSRRTVSVPPLRYTGDGKSWWTP